MPMIRARAYSSSCSQVILVYLHSFCSFAAKNSQKITKTLYFLGFKVIDFDIFKTLVISACYDKHDKQHVCAYLQSFSR